MSKVTNKSVEREVVLAIPTQQFPKDSGVYSAIFCLDGAKNAIFHYRDDLKTNPHFRQPILYITLTDSDYGIFVYQRTKKGGEGRLMGNLSIGLGGHVNPVDSPNTVDDGVWPKPLGTTFTQDIYKAIIHSGIRELKEEASINSIDLEIDGYSVALIDNSNTVGQSHVGITRILHVNKLTFENSTFSDDIHPIGFIPFSDLVNPVTRKAFEEKHDAVFENWSVMLLDHYHSGRIFDTEGDIVAQDTKIKGIIDIGTRLLKGSN